MSSTTAPTGAPQRGAPGGGGRAPASGGPTLSEPRSIVQSLMTKFHAATDIATIEAIDAAYEAVISNRAQRLTESRDTLHQWMKKVEGGKWEAQRPADRSELAHAERMAQLDKDRHALGKAINELELAVQREEASKNQLGEAIAAISARTAALEREVHALGENKVRSLVYREMGINWAIDEIQVNDEGSWRGSTVKCRIISRSHNDVFTLSFPPTAQGGSPYDDANRLWSLIAQ